jgi:hypothetical protein
MKKSICLAASLLAFNLAPVAFGQPNGIPAASPVPPPPSNYQQRLQTIIRQAEQANSLQNQPPALTKFNLDFSGGTPKELVAAIEKAMGKPLNVVIPTEDAEVQIPPLKMNDIVVPQLFAALGDASRRTITVSVGNMPPGSFAKQNVSYVAKQNISYGFSTTDSPMTDTTIWYFYSEKPSPPLVATLPKTCRFYLLEPYFKHGFTVDDITTAIQTGWKMLGDTSPPEISYHKETKLLIAVGEPDKLQVIENVLSALDRSDYAPGPALDPNTGLPLSPPPPKPKAENSGK